MVFYEAYPRARYRTHFVIEISINVQYGEPNASNVLNLSPHIISIHSNRSNFTFDEQGKKQIPSNSSFIGFHIFVRGISNFVIHTDAIEQY